MGDKLFELISGEREVDRQVAAFEAPSDREPADTGIIRDQIAACAARLAGGSAE